MEAPGNADPPKGAGAVQLEPPAKGACVAPGKKSVKEFITKAIRLGSYLEGL